MIDEKTIEEIVRRVVERLLQDPRLQGSVRAGGGRAPQPLARRHYSRVLSEWDVLTVFRSGGRAIQFQRGVIVTPLARDRARDLGVELLVE